LLGGGMDDLAAAVPNVHAPEAGGRLDRFPIAVVFNNDATSAPGHGRAVPQQAGTDVNGCRWCEPSSSAAEAIISPYAICDRRSEAGTGLSTAQGVRPKSASG
jgi:hypothetical protein